MEVVKAEDTTEGRSERQAAAQDIVRLIEGCRFDLSTEKHLQAGVEAALRDRGIAFDRERRLSQQDIPDFVVDGGIVIECKMRKKNKKMAIYKQLVRYASHDDVVAIVLVTNVSMGMPPEINGKPLYWASVSRGWL